MPSERLQKAIDAGGVVELFGLLKDWPADELKALIVDCESLYSDAGQSIDTAFKAAMFTPQVFFSNRNANAVTEARDEAAMRPLAMTSEICSVAYYYLGETVDVEAESDGN